MIEINTYQEYQYCIDRGYFPLINWRLFKMNIDLRIRIQHEMFPVSDFTKANQLFYTYVWDHSIHNCHEYGRPLYKYASVHISHIISRGADRLMSTDPRNANVLSYKAHMLWECPTERKKLNIYRLNQYIIKMLKEDYQ